MSFLIKFNVLTIARGIYRMDAEERLPKEIIKKKLELEVVKWNEDFHISFDLDGIDLYRKGFTRYYPFTVNGDFFIIRLFNIDEKHFLPECEVLHEGVFEESKIGFQIIPGVNAILKGERMEKVPFPDPTVCATNP